MRRAKIAAALLVLVAAAAVAGWPAAAQDMPPLIMSAVTIPASPAAATASETPAGAPGAAAPGAAAPDSPTSNLPAAAPAQSLSQAQLEQLVAPIALYPDVLLGQVLMASTYPLEVVEAARWAADSANRALKGDALTEALKAKGWDPSVMALVAVPRVLDIMSDKLEWTQQVGNAFLVQQADVMVSVQRLRQQAMAAGNLKESPECHCVIKTGGGVISILPADSHVVCIPVYNPKVVYGAWREPEYPPVAFPVPVGFAYAPGFWIGYEPPLEIALFGPLWGWGSIDWWRHAILIDPVRFGRLAPVHIAFAGGFWAHDPAHRRGVAYADPALRARFGVVRAAAVGAVAGRAVLAGAAATFSGPRHGSALRGGAFAAAAAGRRGPAAFGNARFAGQRAQHAVRGPAASARFAARGPGGPQFGSGAFHGGPARFAMNGGPHGGGPFGGGHHH